MTDKTPSDPPDWHPGTLSVLTNCSMATLTSACLQAFQIVDQTMTTSEEPETTSQMVVVPFPVWHVVLFGFLACCIGVVTVGGNLIVILSFVLERSIRQPANYFIASLAVSDLLIGSVSMPLYTVYLLSGQNWPLGEALCDLWLSIDYTACLCSIYTVFCITADRFCSVKLPAKYRKWRTGRKIVVIVVMTWTIPMAVFFTSIFGWQHFVGRRTVPSGRCYVQYMEDALFNCFLQVGYFWITLTAMFVLYAGIYRVALDLHRRSAAQREKTMSCLVSMAGRTVTQIGSVISITRNPCRLQEFTRPEPGCCGGHARLASFNDSRWDPGNPRRDYGGMNPYLTPGTVPYFSFLFARGGGGESGQARPNPIIDECEAKRDVINEAVPPTTTESVPSHVTGGNDRLASNRSDKIPTSGNREPAQSAEHSCVDDDDDTSVAMANATNGVVMETAASDHAASEPETHELEVLLPGRDTSGDDDNSSAICPKKRNRFRVTKRLNPFALSPPEVLPAASSSSSTSGGRDQLPPATQGVIDRGQQSIDEIELQSKRNDGQNQVTRSRLPVPVQTKDDVSSGDDDSDDEDGDDVTRRNAAPTTFTPLPPFAHSGSNLQPIARLIRCGLRGGGGRHPSGGSRRAQQQQQRNDNRTRKALRTITLILGAFVVCWIPWHVLSMIIGFCGETDRNRCVKPILYDISYWLCYLNSPINPFCYAFANQQFKKTFIRIIRLDWRRNN